MQLHVVERGEETYTENTALVQPVFADGDAFGGLLSEEMADSLERLRSQKRIQGKRSEVYFSPTPAASFAGVLTIGLGGRDAFDAEILRRSAGSAVGVLQAQRIDRVVFDATAAGPVPLEAFVEGIMLGQYDYGAYKRKGEDPAPFVDEIVFVVGSNEGLEDIRLGCGTTVLMCQNTNWARDLACMPPNALVPAALVSHAHKMAKEVDAEFTVFDEEVLRRMGMHAILAVGRGSSKGPKLMILEHRHPDAKTTLALVGKGITFDTGGISIKPSQGMHEMKYDMCGAAAVLGAFKTIAQSKARVNLICVVPAAENKTGADAQRPGDIVRAYNGKTIEVHNTDAEGRMVLADALAYTVEQYKPDAIVDVATLTGAVIIALGHYAAGLMSTDDELAGELQLAAEATGERVWPFPLWEDYAELLKGTHADLCNIGPERQAGAIMGGCFLKEFAGDTRWAHIDIAGTAWGVDNIPYLNKKHATGFGVRLLSQWILDELQHG